MSRVRPAHMAVAAGVAAVALVGVLGVGALRAVELPNARPIDRNDMMRVEVVAPREPDVTEGSVMEVGDLVDGYEHRPPRVERAIYEDEWSVMDLLEAPARAPRIEYDETPDTDRYRPMPTQPERRGRWFGFDDPRPDWRAEREERRARREAEARERWERDQAWERDRRDWERERAYADDRREWEREQARREQALRDDRRPFLREEPRWGDPDAPPVG